MSEDNENKYTQLMELSLKKPYYILAVCLLIAHLLLEIFYLAFGCTVIAGVNVVSIAVYAYLVFAYDRMTRKRGIGIIFVAVLLFSLVAVGLYGDDACYSINVVPLIPIVWCWDYESRYVYREDTKGRIKWSLLFIGVVYVAEQFMDGLDFYVYQTMTEHQVNIICFYNFATLFIGVLIGTAMWWNLTNHTAQLLEESLKNADYLAGHDTLTGLRNRKSLDDYIRELERKNREYAFMIADIDDFKKFNDTYGHDCGDMVLQNISHIISGNFRNSDAVFRWGGEEIVIVMTDVHRKLAEERAKKICKAIEESTNYYHGEKMTVTVTIGVAVSKGRVFHEVMKEADQFLFQGKDVGKNCAVGEDGKIL